MELHNAGVGVGVGLDDLNLTLVCSKYLSGVLLDILRPALVPVRQEIDGRGGRAEPQQVGRLLVQEGVIIQQILTQHGSEGAGKGREVVPRRYTTDNTTLRWIHQRRSRLSQMYE